MIISNGAGNIQSSKIDELNKKYNEIEIELDRNYYGFCTSLSTKDMFEYKTKVNRNMLDLINIQSKLERIERGWE